MKHNYKYWLVVPMILAIFGTTKSFSLFESPKVEKRPVLLLEKLIYEKVNEQRTMHNLPALEWTDDVAEVARKHSEDMASRGYFAHENKQRELVGERLSKYGIVFTVSAENLFKCENYPDVVEESVRGWMLSLGHRENILNEQVEETGVGVYKVNGKDEYYITQNFIKRALKFIPLPPKLSGESISEIFDMVKNAAANPGNRNISPKDSILKKLSKSGISVKRDFVVEGFWKDSLSLKLKVDFLIDGGFIVHFTDNEQEKETFRKLITPNGYSAVLLIRIAKERIEYLLIKSEE